MHILTLFSFHLCLALFWSPLSTLASPVTSSLLVRANADYPDPAVDPFYAQPAGLNGYSNGQVIRSRAVPSTISSSNLKQAYQIMFRSTDTNNKAVGAVTTLFVPKTLSTATKGGAASLLSLQIPQDSVAFDCAASWALIPNSGSNAAGGASIFDTVVASWAITQGYYVSIPDHEGPQATFIVGRTEGHIVLDAIRGSLNHEGLSSSSTQVALYGYSGGAHASVWADSLAPSYASELKVVGSTYGGTPIDVENVFNYIDGGIFSGFAGAGLVGISTAYPALKKYIDAHINAAGKAKLEALVQPGVCLPEVVISETLTEYEAYINVTNPLKQPIPQKVLKQETLLTSKASWSVPTIKTPRLIFHALLDEIIPLSDAQAYVKQQCSAGANIQFMLIPLAEHATGEIEGVPSVTQFISQAFAGTTPKVSCGSTVNPISILASTTTKLLGGVLQGQLVSEEASAKQLDQQRRR